MKQLMLINKIIIKPSKAKEALFIGACFAFLSFGMFSCKSSTSNKTHTETKEAEDEHDHDHDEHTNLVTLSDEQIKAVDIAFGGIEMKELTSTIKANGNLKVPNNVKAMATSLYGGVVTSIYVQVGSAVKKGQVIASIKNPQFIQMQEDYLTAASEIVLAEEEFQRQQELFSNNAGAKKNLQNADAQLKILKTKRASLEQQLKLAGISPANLKNSNLVTDLKVLSPIHGNIANINAQIGSYVDASTPVAEIVDNASLHLDLKIFEKDLPLIKIGQIIHFTLTNNPVREYDAEVFSIGTAFDSDSRTIPVHAKVLGNKSGLIDGMNITGIVSLSNTLAPAVPNEAIVESEGKKFIFIIHQEGKSHIDEASNSLASGKETEFEKVEVITGTSEMGYTAIVPIKQLAKDVKIVTKSAFFINATMVNTGGHDH